MFKLSSSTRLVAASGFIVCALLIASMYPGRAEASPLLGTAQSFAVLGGSTVTNTGPTTVEGNLGVSPGSAVTGFPPGIVINGTIHTADEVAGQAQSDVTTAYVAFAGLPCDFDLTDQDLGGLTLIPGVYCFSSSAQLTGALTLDAMGNPDAMFVFQIGSTLITASNASVLMIGGSLCNVFWQVGSSATLGTTTAFVGNILALTSITLNTGAVLAGRALAQNGAVTMDTNDVSTAGCATAPELPTATAELPTATSELPTATAELPAATSDIPTATTDVPAPAPETATPVTPAPETSTPVIPGPIAPTPETPAPILPSPATATPITPILETPNPVVPIPETPAPGTPTSTLPSDLTATPSTSSSTPVTSGTVTPTPETPGSAATTTPATAATPTSRPTSTPATIVRFPDTGSGGLLSLQNDQPVAYMNLVISIAIVMLATVGLGVFVERRSRR